jgi:hypothetical protein
MQLQSTISRALDELERRRFRHFLQQEQGFFEVENQFFSTFGFLAAGPQSRNILRSIFLVKKFRRAANTIHKQLLIEN